MATARWRGREAEEKHRRHFSCGGGGAGGAGRGLWRGGADAGVAGREATHKQQ